MGQIFPSWWNKLPLVAALAAVLVPTLATAGVWYYFPATLLVKTPLSLLLLLFLALGSVELWSIRARELVTIALSVAVFLLSAMAGKIDIGVRHILPVYPLLIPSLSRSIVARFQQS